MSATTTLKSSGKTSTTQAVARYKTPRRPERPTIGPQISFAAKMLGIPLMPWQRDFADVLGEFDPKTGIPYYRTAFYTVPRQSGKTLLGMAWALAVCMAKPSRRIAWSAQTGKDARDKWIDELFPMINGSEALKVTRHLHRGMGNEKIELNNDSLVRLVSNSAKAGHGKTLHGSFEDEIFADVDAWRENAFGPAMLTVPEAQTLKTSTAGTASSTIYNSLRRKGREAVTEGQSEDLAYLEYSADDDWDYLDPKTYVGHMPAVGFTVSERSVRSAIDAMLLDPKEGADGVRRAYGNISAGRGEGSIPAAVFERVCDRDVFPDGDMVFAMAVSEDRSSAAIGVTDRSGNFELIECKGGVGWVAERANQISNGRPVVFDSSGPAASLAHDVTDAQAMSSAEVFAAHAAFFDAVVECDGVAVRHDTAVTKAVAGAVKKSFGDRFMWSRKASTEDVTPLEVLTLSWGAARTAPEAYTGPLVVVS